MACGILVSQPGTELVPPTVETGVFNTGPPQYVLFITAITENLALKRYGIMERNGV